VEDTALLLLHHDGLARGKVALLIAVALGGVEVLDHRDAHRLLRPEAEDARVADIQRDHLVALTFELLGTASQLPSDLVTDAFEMGTGLQRTDRHGRSSARKRRVFCPESTTPESGRLSGSSGRSPSSRGNARIPRSQEIPM